MILKIEELLLLLDQSLVSFPLALVSGCRELVEVGSHAKSDLVRKVGDHIDCGFYLNLNILNNENQ